MTLPPPFLYPGAKRKAATLVWERFGHVNRYIEPFAGSLAVLLARPGERDGKGEVVNDADGHIINVWRAIRHAPDEVAWWLEGPASKADLNARHRWTHSEGRARAAGVFTDPLHHDPQAAAWFLYGLNFAAHPRAYMDPKARLGRPAASAPAGQGHFSSRLRPIGAYLEAVARRLERATILAGDWAGCVSPTMLTWRSSRGGFVDGTIGVFLDPPYTDMLRRSNLYGTDSGAVAADVLAWCQEWGHRQGLRICLAGYQSEHDVLEGEGWRVESWSSAAGGSSRHDERLWFSPACLPDAAEASLDLLGAGA
jgi:DNA adenine methylase